MPYTVMSCICDSFFPVSLTVPMTYTQVCPHGKATYVLRRYHNIMCKGARYVHVR